MITPKHSKKIIGWQLLELTIVVSIVIILASITLFFSRSFIGYNQATGDVNRLVQAIRYTRYQAIKQGQNMIFCGSSNGHTCDGQWQKGQITIAQKTQYVLRVYPHLIHHANLTWNSGQYLQLSPLGFLAGAPGSLHYCVHQFHYARSIKVNHVGRAYIMESDQC